MSKLPEGLYSAKIPLYGGKILILFSNDFLGDGRKLGVEYQLDINSQCVGLASRRKKTGAGEYLMMVKKHHFSNWDILAHEALHLTNYILSDRGVEVSLSNDEAQAYLLGWITGQIQRCREQLNSAAKQTLKV